jgi:hypothetical protein
MSVNDYDAELTTGFGGWSTELELEENSPAHGVALQVIHQGYNSLSSNQRYLYDSQVAPLLGAQADTDEVERRYDPD